MIGSLAARSQGEPTTTDLDLEQASGNDALAARLSRALSSYGDVLSTFDRDVLRRACVVSRGVDLATLTQLARGSIEAAGALRSRTKAALFASLRRLENMGLLAAEGGTQRLSAHPFVSQHFQRELGDGHRSVHEVLRRSQQLALTSHGPTSDQRSLDTLEALLEHTLGDLRGARCVPERDRPCSVSR